MPSLKVLLTGDSRPLEKEFLKVQEISAKTSAKTIQHMEQASAAIQKQMSSVERGTLAWQNYYAELKNVELQLAAFKNQADQAARAADLERYLASPSQSTLLNPREGLAADQAAYEQRRNGLRGLLQTMKEARAESERYLASPSQSGFVNPRGSMASDQAAWAAKLAAFRASTGSSGLSAAGWAEKMAGNLKSAATNANGLNLILRETLVVFREIGRGNWSRVPGSLSLIAQGFSTLKGISLATMGAWAFAIGGIIGSFLIFHARVTSLAKSLQTTLESTFNPEHIAAYLGKLQILSQLEKDAADQARKVREAHDSVGESIQRQLDLTKDRIGFERELLEIQKANELAAAQTPAAREAIEKKYSPLILAKKKEERDAELKALQNEAKNLPTEILQAKKEIASITNGDYTTEGRDQQILKKRMEDSAAWNEYRKQLLPGQKDERELSADKDRKTLMDFARKEAYYNAHKSEIQLAGADAVYRISDTDVAKRNAAQERLNNSASTRKALNDWIDSGDARTRQRERVKELEDKMLADQKRLAALGPGGNGIIADTLRKNIQKDKEDLALENERLKRTNAPGSHNGQIGPGLTQFERAGGLIQGVSNIDISKQQLSELKGLHRTIKAAIQFPHRGVKF